MPLAVKRGLVSDLPMDFVLDDSTAMSPDFKLSSVPEVRIEVRVSRNGSATPSAGDLIGQGPVVKPGATGVAVQIDQIRP
jgi:cytochrome c-type biogenesis protein CcmH